MLENGYEPTRTVALGFDEESSGKYVRRNMCRLGLILTSRRGAQLLAPELVEMFGENGYAVLVDEGGKEHNLIGVAVC